MERRVHTDIGYYVGDTSNGYEEDDFDPNEAYARMHEQEDSPNDIEENEDRQATNEDDDEQLDYNNYKGIYFNDDPSSKYQDPETGAHFNYHDMCRRLNYLIKLQKKEEAKMYAHLQTEPADPQRVREEIHDKLETLKSDQFGTSYTKIHEDPKLTKTLSLGRQAGPTKPTTQHNVPYISGGGTGGSGGTRNFLSSGNVAPKSMNQDNTKLSVYNNLSSLQQKQMLQRAMRNKGLSVGPPQRAQPQPDFARNVATKYYKGSVSKGQSQGKSPATSVKLGSAGQSAYVHGQGTKYYQNTYKSKGILPEHRAYEEMLERQVKANNRTIDRKRKAASGTQARVHTQANDQDLYFKTDSRELLTLYQEKKRNLGLGASSKVLPESAGKKLPKTMLRKSGEQPTAGYSYHGQKSRNNENVRGSGSHGPVVGKSANYYNSAGAAAPQRSSNMKSYATLEQLNYKHSMGLKHGASKGQLQSGPGYKKPGAKVYMQSNYNYRGMGSSMGHHFPASSASQLQSALFQSYMKPGSQGSRIDLKSGGEKRKTISSGNRTGIESYTTSVKQQTRKKPSETDKLSMLKPVGIAAEKYARSTFGR